MVVNDVKFCCKTILGLLSIVDNKNSYFGTIIYFRQNSLEELLAVD